MAKTYTLQEMGQKLKQANPGRFDKYSDAQLAQYYVEAKPQMKDKVLKQSTFGGFAKGVGKSVTSTVKETAKLGERAFDATLRGVLPKSLEKKFGVSKSQQLSTDILQGQAEKALDITHGSLTEARTPSQRIGKFTGDVAQYLIPGGAVTKAGKTAEAAILANKATSNIGKVSKATTFGSKIAKHAPQVFSDTGVALAQTGDPKAAVTSGVVTGAFPVFGAGIKKVTKGFSKFGKEILGKSTGAGTQAVKEAFDNPNVIKFARESGKRGVDELMEESLGEAKKGLQVLRDKRGLEYKDQLSRLQLTKDLKPVYDNVLENASKLSDELETIVEGKNIVDKAIDDVAKWRDFTADGLDTLKRRLQSYERQLDGAGRAPAKRIVSDLKDKVRQGLNDSVPGYSEMTRGYAKASELIDEIESALSLGDKKQKETAIRKLLQTVKRDDDTRRDLLRAVSEASGVDLTGKISGALLGQRLPRGMAGAFTPGIGSIGLAAGLFNPTFWAALVPYAAVSSPRFVAEIGNIAIKLKKLKPGEQPSIQLQRLIRQTLLELQRDLNKK